jgi:predicted nucleic acid-binding protein
VKDAWAFLKAVFASPGLGMIVETEWHAHVAAEVLAEIPGVAVNIVFEAHTAILMRENDVRALYTHDSDFNRVAFIDVLDPARGHRRSSARRRR